MDVEMRFYFWVSLAVVIYSSFSYGWSVFKAFCPRDACYTVYKPMSSVCFTLHRFITWNMTDKGAKSCRLVVLGKV